MKGRVRISRFVVHIEAFADDGADLTPLQIEPLVYPAADWRLFDLDALRDRWQDQLDDVPLDDVEQAT